MSLTQPKLTFLRTALLTLLLTAVCRGQSPPSFLFMLGDDIGWSDFRYNNGTAVTPRITNWISRKGSVLFQDFHTGGTVCSPTRATILTGRNHFRDCVNYVYVPASPPPQQYSPTPLQQRTILLSSRERYPPSFP